MNSNIIPKTLKKENYDLILDDLLTYGYIIINFTDEISHDNISDIDVLDIWEKVFERSFGKDIVKSDFIKYGITESTGGLALGYRK